MNETKWDFGKPEVFAGSEGGARVKIAHWFAKCPQCGQVADIASVRPGDKFDDVECWGCGLALAEHGQVYQP